MPQEKTKINCWIDARIMDGKGQEAFVYDAILKTIAMIEGINVISFVNCKDIAFCQDNKGERALYCNSQQYFFILKGKKHSFLECECDMETNPSSEDSFFLRAIKAASHPYEKNEVNYVVTEKENTLQTFGERRISTQTNIKVFKLTDFMKEIRKYLYHGENTRAFAFSKEYTTQMGLTRWESFVFAPLYFTPNIYYLYGKNMDDYTHTLREKIANLLRTRANIEKYTRSEYLDQGNALLDNIKYYFDYWCSLVVSMFDILEKIIGNKYDINEFDLRIEDKINQLSNQELKIMLLKERSLGCLFYAIRNLIVHDTGHGSVRIQGRPWGYIYANEKYLGSRNKEGVNSFFTQHHEVAEEMGVKRTNWCLGEKTDSLEIDPVVFVKQMTPVLGNYINNVLLLLSGEGQGIDKYERFIEDCNKDNNHWFYASLAFLESI